MKKRKTKKKKSNFVQEDTRTDFQIYKNGAFLGALLGGVASLVIGKRIILGITVGAIAGGYIAYQIHKDDNISGLKALKTKTNNTFKKPQIINEDANNDTE